MSESPKNHEEAVIAKSNAQNLALFEAAIENPGLNSLLNKYPLLAIAFTALAGSLNPNQTDWQKELSLEALKREVVIHEAANAVPNIPIVLRLSEFEKKLATIVENEEELSSQKKTSKKRNIFTALEKLITKGAFLSPEEAIGVEIETSSQIFTYIPQRMHGMIKANLLEVFIEEYDIRSVSNESLTIIFKVLQEIILENEHGDTELAGLARSYAAGHYDNLSQEVSLTPADVRQSLLAQMEAPDSSKSKALATTLLKKLHEANILQITAGEYQPSKFSSSNTIILGINVRTISVLRDDDFDKWRLLVQNRVNVNKTGGIKEEHLHLTFNALKTLVKPIPIQP